MASSFGGTVKLTGESEYIRALKNINSNLRAVSSEIKLASTEFTNNGNKLADLRIKNEALNKKYQEEQNIIKTCTLARMDFSIQNGKLLKDIDNLKNSLDAEKKSLENMKNSTTATSDEISKQEEVVADLVQKLSKAEGAYDSNSRKINDYTVKLNDAEKESIDLSKEIKSNDDILNKLKYKFNDGSKSVKEFAEEEEKAKKTTLSLGDIIKGNLISEGIIAGVKGLASAMKTVGNAMLDVGKSALDGYGNYEQLIGGVETLFKDSAGVVEGYANNAYKTAGLSANEYMETVTSFSASLLQSLNGDTAESAKVADMAITDMSDNANKMGTDMSMIQNAYQGFAKQNYTMLDNLKLGYGGTKGEMERLLADAQKISGIEYDISNLNDVYNAIHVIQGELGITGTTAKEASTTIQGSVGSMKSAWQNLVTGIGDGNADIHGLIENFISSVTTALDNLIPVINSIVDNIITGLKDSLPIILEKGSELLTTLLQGISDKISDIMPVIVEIINTIVDTLVNNLPTILNTGIQIVLELVNGISETLPELIPQMINAVVSMVDTLLDNIDLIIDAGIQLIFGLIDGLLEALPDLIDRIPEIIDKIVTAISDNLPKLIEAGITLTFKLAEGLIKAIPQLVSKVPQIIGSLVGGIASQGFKLFDKGKELLGNVVSGITSSISKMSDIGKNMVQGLWNGINNAKDWVLGKIKGFGSAILDGIKGFFGIHSPSTLFRDEIGLNMAKGIGVGFQEEMKDVNASIKSALPKDIDLATNVNLNNLSANKASNRTVDTPMSRIENNTYNIYSPKDSPSEYARLIRKEKQYQLLTNNS